MNPPADTAPLPPALLLLPNLIAEHRRHELFLPSSIDRAVASLDGLIAESASAGRRFLGRFKTKKPPHQIPLALFNVNTPDNDVDFLLDPIKKGERWGYVSDSGLPCIADPGAKLVRRARQLGIDVQAFVGPSSLMLALMLSGLPGQRFAFQGYLEHGAAALKQNIVRLEKRSKEDDATQIFMEAPYRNQKIVETLIETLHEATRLCIAWDLTLPSQGVICQSIKIWKKYPLPNLSKRNALFLIHA